MIVFHIMRFCVCFFYLFLKFYLFILKGHHQIYVWFSLMPQCEKVIYHHCYMIEYIVDNRCEQLLVKHGIS